MDNGSAQAPKDQSMEAPMEQVRELLFGAQLKDMELRFKRQEERFLREIHDARDSLKNRLDSLENFMKSEVSSLAARLRQEQEERDAALKAEIRERTEAQRKEERDRLEALKNEENLRLSGLGQLGSDINNMTEAFERRLSKLAATVDSVERDLKALLLSESGSLNGKIETKYSDALKALAGTAGQIRSDMVHRSSLSSLFAEMVGGLSSPWPGAAGDPARIEGGLHYSHDQDEHASEAIHGEPNENHGEEPPVIHIGSADAY